VSGSPLDGLPAPRRTEVMAAVAAVETAEQPVPGNAFRALAEAPMRHVVEQVLAVSGRVLLRSGNGYLSGYDDTIVARFIEEGTGVLPPEDRAVLTLVVLFTVAIPRAERTIPTDAPWSRGEPVPRERLKDSRLPDNVIDSALRRLRDARIISSGPRGISPGPQFHRLTAAASARIFEELVLLAEPGGSLAEQVRRRRLARAAGVGGSGV
jgi:hypothetical protein